MMRVVFLLGMIISFWASSHAYAHTRSQSFSHWEITGQVIDLSFAVDARRVTQLAPLYAPGSDLNRLLLLHVQETVQVIQNSEPCSLVMFKVSGTGRSLLRVTGRFACKKDLSSSTARAIVTSFQAVSPTHIHIARVVYAGSTSEFVLREGRSVFALQSTVPVNDFTGFVTTGFLHVLSGLDHLVFLLAMIIVARTLRLTIFCITGFTLGHTLSLALATLGWIEPDEQLIEAMIGLTIAMTALESGVRDGLNRRDAMVCFSAFIMFVVLVPLVMSQSAVFLGVALAVYVLATAYCSQTQAMALLPLITTVFGLVHGAGFAGGLKEVMLHSSEIAMPLLGFNIGVEVAQLVALMSIVMLLSIFRRTISLHMVTLMHLTGVSVFALGCFWFSVRLWV